VYIYNNWAFFRKKAADGPFEIYTDFESRVDHYKRVTYLLGTVLGVNVLIALFNVYLAIVGFLICVLFIPIMISYLRKMKDLKKEQALYDK